MRGWRRLALASAAWRPSWVWRRCMQLIARRELTYPAWFNPARSWRGVRSRTRTRCWRMSASRNLRRGCWRWRYRRLNRGVRSSTMFLRLGFGGVALAFPRLAIGNGHMRDLPAVTAPTLWKLSATIFARILFVPVTLTALGLAILDGGFRDLAVDAAPTVDMVRFTHSGRFFSGAVALTFPPPANLYSRLNDLAVNAAPAFLLAMPQRFVFGRVAFQASLAAIFRVTKDRHSIDAAPTLRRRTMPARFFLGTVAGSLGILAGRLGGMDDLSIDAAPTITRRRLTMFLRLIFALIACSLVLLALLFGGVDDHSVNAAPTTTRVATRILKRFFSGRVARTIILPAFPAFPSFSAFFADVDRPFAALSRSAQVGHSVLTAPTLSWRRWRRRRNVSWRWRR
jgi:hypothetical protein